MSGGCRAVLVRAVLCCGTIALGASTGAGASGPEPAAAETALPIESFDSLPPTVELELGELVTLPVDQATRVAIGSPEIADITLLSTSEILLQAKSPGTTTLIVWDRQGQHTIAVEVTQRGLGEVEAQLRRMLAELSLGGVRVKQEDGTLFLTGAVATKEQLDQVDHLRDAFKEPVTNLVTVAEAGLDEAAKPLVRLGVQIIEVNRKDVEKLGIKWAESVAATEPEATDRTLSNVLFRWGTSLTRSSVAATLNALVQRNRARLLSEPTLVTASGTEASSFIGVEVPIVTATSFGTATSTVSASIEFRKTGVLLKMTPTVQPAPDGAQAPRMVKTLIEAEVSGLDTSVSLSVPVGNQTVSVPGFKVRKAQTEVMTPSGESIVIAGLLEVEDSHTVSQVPSLGSLPILGRVFRSPELTGTQRELLIVVTPLVLAGEEATPRDAALAEAVASTQVTASPASPTLAYALQVQQRLAQGMRYPEPARERGVGGSLRLRLHLARDGTLDQAEVVQSSGDAALDAEATSAARRQSPYPPFPDDLPQPDLWLELPVQFQP